MKGFFLASIIILGLCSTIPRLSSQENKLSELLKEHKAKVQELAQLRQKAISEDTELKELHNQILELHAKLALKLEQKPEIKQLYDKIIKLEKDIDSERSENEKNQLKLLKND